MVTCNHKPLLRVYDRNTSFLAIDRHPVRPSLFPLSLLRLFPKFQTVIQRTIPRTVTGLK